MSDNQKINYPDSIIDQLKQKHAEEARKRDEELKRQGVYNQIMNRVNSPANPGTPLIQEAYRPPTLIDRIETLERQVNHLMHLIGTKG